MSIGQTDELWALWLVVHDVFLIPMLFAYISMKWRSIGETDKMFSIEKILDLHKIASPVFLSFPGSHQCAVVNILTGSDCFSQILDSLIFWSTLLAIILFYKSISYSHQELNLPLLLTCLLSLWLMPQLSCYHLASVKSFEMKWWWWHPEMPGLQGDSSAGHRSVNIHYLHYNLQFAR